MKQNITAEQLNEYVGLGKYLFEIHMLEWKLTNKKFLDAQDTIYRAKIDYLKAKAKVENRPKSLIERILR